MVRWAVAAVALVCLASVALGDSIRLNRSAVAPEGGAVTLGMVASLSGPLAERASEVVVLDGSSARPDAAFAEVTLEDVRAALLSAGVRSGGVALSGKRCVVRFRGGEAGFGLRRGADEEAEGARWTPGGSMQERATIGGAAVRMLADDLSVELDELRIRFPAGGDALAGRRVDGDRLALRRVTGLGERVVFSAVVFGDGGAVEARGRVTVEVEVERGVWRASSRVERGETVGVGAVERVREWRSPGAAETLGWDESPVGLEARERLEEGELVMRSSVERAKLVERRSWAKLYCLSGGLVIEARVLVLEDGRLGDLVPCRLDGRRDLVIAEVTGPGELTVTLGR